MPVLGICYGEQAMAQQLGGKVEAGHHREFGRAEVLVTEDTPLFEGVWQKGERYPVWMSHGDRVTALPQGFRVVGTSPNAPIAMIADEKRKFYATQFHLEVMHTPHGAALLRNFVRKIARLPRRLDHARLQGGGDREDPHAGRQGPGDLRAVRRRRFRGRGGADPRGDRRPAHLRVRRSRPAAARRGARPWSTCSAATTTSRWCTSTRRAQFLGALAGVTDPEAKRKTIGKLFIDVFEAEAKKIGGAEFLAQGTLYPDVIESVSFTGGPSVTIKSHHNVGGLPERMNMKLVEPLRELFKDEVRALGRELGLPEAFVGRHPFPGPGLAIRCPGEITPREARHPAAAPTRSTSRRSAAPGSTTRSGRRSRCSCRCKTVGVMGDGRTYDYVVGLRAVTSTDGMTADFYPFDMKFIGHVATRIINEVKGVNRVVYDVTIKPPGTIEWE